MSAIKTVVFDIDNTLYDFVTANRLGLDALAAYTAEQFGWSRDEFEKSHKEVQEEIYRYTSFNGSCRNRILRYQKMLEKAHLPLYPHALRMYNLYWNTLLDAMVPFEGVQQVMRTLRERGLRIGVGTDMTAMMQLRKLEKLGVLDCVDFMVTSEEAGAEKPSRIFFDMVLAKAECLPQECLFVGDHLQKDAHGALDAGMQALWYHPGDVPAVSTVWAGSLTGVGAAEAESAYVGRESGAADDQSLRITSLTQIIEYIQAQ